MNKTLSGRLRELKNKRKLHLGNPKSGRSRLRERSLYESYMYFSLQSLSRSLHTGLHKSGRN